MNTQSKEGKTSIIACLGKGGAGKTAISTLLGRSCISRGLRPLFVDADPVLGLQRTLGISSAKSIAEAREELIEYARRHSLSDGETSREAVDYILMNVLTEQPDFGFIAMGHSTEKGCFCPVNNLLRETLSEAAEGFNPVIIDAEAGIEQVSRMVVETIDTAFLISDLSRRGVEACLTIDTTIAAAESMAGCRRFVVLNRTEAVPAVHGDFLRRHGLSAAGSVPEDEALCRADMEGTSLLSLPADSAAQSAVAEILDRCSPSGSILV